jgi:hypothetical protein
MKKSFCPMIFGLVWILMFIYGCNEPQLKSAWRQSNVSDTGTNSSWESGITYSLEDKNVVIGFQNNENSMFIMLRAEDQATQAKIMRSGLTIWFDKSCKKNKTFGIHYPIGMQGYMRDHKMQQQGGWQPGEEPHGDQPPGQGVNNNNGGFLRSPLPMMDSMEIIGPNGEERQKVPVKNNLGVSASRSDVMGTMTYEFTIPLMATNETPFAIDTKPGSIIGLGLETGSFKLEASKGDSDKPDGKPEGSPGGFGGQGGGFGRDRGDTYGDDGGGSGGGPGGGMGGRSGGMGRRGGRGMGSSGKGQSMNMEPMKFWARVILSNQISSDK